MATRTSIKNKAKAKLGAAAALAAGGVAFSLDAGAANPLDAGTSALLDSAFKLLEEGHQADQAQAEQEALSRTKLEVNPAAMGAEAAQPLDHQLMADVTGGGSVADDVPTGLQLAQAHTGGEATSDIVIAQAQTTSADAAVAVQASSATVAPASGAAVAAETAAIVSGPVEATGVGAFGVAPLAQIVAAGASVATVVGAAVLDTGGSDLNDNPSVGLNFSSADMVNLSGKTGSTESSTPPGGYHSSGFDSKLGLIGSSYIDGNFDKFFDV